MAIPRQHMPEKLVPEIEKIVAAAADPTVPINLWFEDDLFCQVNCWFVCSLLAAGSEVFLIRPTTALQFGFGGMDKPSLQLAFDQREQLSQDSASALASLWRAYQNNDWVEMKSIASAQPEMPFLAPAVRAHIERFPADGSLGRPHKSLQEICQTLGASEFGPIFKAFSKRKPFTDWRFTGQTAI